MCGVKVQRRHRQGRPGAITSVGPRAHAALITHPPRATLRAMPESVNGERPTLLAFQVDGRVRSIPETGARDSSARLRHPRGAITWGSSRRAIGRPHRVLAVLHTWGQTLVFHPHRRCVVPGGGPSTDGSRWIACRRGFFQNEASTAQAGRPAARRPVRRRSWSAAFLNGRFKRPSRTVRPGMRRTSSASASRASSRCPASPDAAARTT